MYDALVAQKQHPDTPIVSLKLHALVDRLGRPSEIDILLNGWLIVEVEMEDSQSPGPHRHHSYVPKQCKKIEDLIASGHQIERVQQHEVCDAVLPLTLQRLLSRLQGIAQDQAPCPVLQYDDIRHPLGYWTKSQLVTSLRDAAGPDGIVRISEIRKQPKFRGLDSAFRREDVKSQAKILACARVRLSSPNWFASNEASSGKHLTLIGQACLIRVLRKTRGILVSNQRWPDSYSAGLPQALSKEFGSLRRLAAMAGLPWMDNGNSLCCLGRVFSIVDQPGGTSLEKAISKADSLGWRFGWPEWVRLREVLYGWSNGKIEVPAIQNAWQTEDGQFLPSVQKCLADFFMRHKGCWPPRQSWKDESLLALRDLIRNSPMGYMKFCKSLDLLHPQQGGKTVSSIPNGGEGIWRAPTSWPNIGIRTLSS